MHARTHAYRASNTQMHAYILINMHARTHTRMHTHTCTQKIEYMHASVYSMLCVRVCVRACVRVCMLIMWYLIYLTFLLQVNGLTGGENRRKTSSTSFSATVEAS